MLIQLIKKISIIIFYLDQIFALRTKNLSDNENLGLN